MNGKGENGMGEHYDRYNGMEELLATDINVATKDSTNLAEVGTDCISRRQAIETFKDCAVNGVGIDGIVDALNQLPLIQPDKNKVSNLLYHKMYDTVSRQEAIDALDEQIEQCDKSLSSFDISIKDEFAVKVERASLVAFRETLEYMPSAQPERTCVNCGRTANNGGWYADGRTRCPIEEHYALPKDGYCHLWEKRNVTDDDYPERREE